jgi:hypothetical protein
VDRWPAKAVVVEAVAVDAVAGAGNANHSGGEVSKATSAVLPGAANSGLTNPGSVSAPRKSSVIGSVSNLTKGVLPGGVAIPALSVTGQDRGPVLGEVDRLLDG